MEPTFIMNKIFKTIWNKELGSFVAVGENGKSQTKSGRLSKAIKSAIAASLIGLSGAASAIVSYDVNGWITGTEGIYLNNYYGASDSINVGLINVGDNFDGGAENALYWNDGTASFQGELTTNSLINLSVADLEFADEVYYNNDYSVQVENGATYVNGLIDLGSLDDATVTLNGTINQQINTNDVDNSGFYNIFHVDGEMFSSTLTSNGSIMNSVASSYSDQTDVEGSYGESFYSDSTTFNLADVNESTFTNNSSVVSTQSTSLDFNVEQDINDITTFNGDDGEVGFLENGTTLPYNSGSDWISYDDFTNTTYDVDQRHVFTSAGEVLDSTITNNGSIVMSSNAGLDVTLDLDNGSVALYDTTLGDVDAVSITDVTGNNFTADSETYAYEFVSLIDSTFQNNGVINVSDVVDYNVAINYGGVDDSTSSWTSSVSYDPDTSNASFSTFTSDNDATLSSNTFTAYSSAAAVSIDNLDTTTSTDNASITNDSSMLVSSTLNYSLGLEQRQWGDITASFSTGNLIDARSAAAGIEMVSSGYSQGLIGTPQDLTITNNDLISAVATNNFSLSGQDTTGDANLSTALGYVTAEARGVYLYDQALGTEEVGQTIFPDDIAFTNDSMYNSIINNTGTILATANLAASMPDVTYDSTKVFASAVGIDNRNRQLAWSLTDPTDNTTEVDTTTDVGLNNSGTIQATATASEAGNAFAAGYIAEDDTYLNERDLYAMQNSGTIMALASANYDDALAVGVQIQESDLKWDNSGSITAVATSTMGDAAAYGQYFNSDLFNIATQSGSMTVTAVSGSNASADAVAFYLGNEIDMSASDYGKVDNSGSIVVTAANDQGFYARARFIEQDQQEGNITNSGSVRVYAQGAFDVSAVAIDNDDLQADGDFTQGGPGSITNSGLLAAYTETSFTEDNIEDGADSFTLNTMGILTNDMDGVIENTGGVILAQSEYNNFDPVNGLGLDLVNPLQFTVGINAGDINFDGIIRNNDSDGLNAGTIRALAITDSSFDLGTMLGQGSDSYQMVNGIFVGNTAGYDDSVDSYVSTIENEVGGYVGALLDGRTVFDGDATLDGYLLDYSNNLELSNVAGVLIQEHRGIFNNGQNLAGGAREYYNATVEGYLNFNTNQLEENFEALEGGTLNGYSLEDLATLGLETTDLVYNTESSYQMIAGSMTGRDNYAFIEPTLNGGVTSGLRYNLAYKNFLADNNLYGDGGYSVIIDPSQNNFTANLGELTGEVNNYCYGVFEGQVFIGQTDLAFYNAGRINTRIDSSYIASSFEQTDTGILQIALEDNQELGNTFGSFAFDGDVVFGDQTNIRISVRDDDVDGLTTAELDGDTLSSVLFDDAGTNTDAFAATTYVVQDNRLDINFEAAFDGVNSVDVSAYDTGLTTLEAAAARPTKDLGWLLDDYNLLHDADYQTRELNAYLYHLGSSDTRADVNARLHKALPLLAGGNTLSNMQLLNDTRNNIEDRLVSRLDQKVGDVYMGKKNAWFRAFGNDQSQSTRDATAGYDSKALGGTFGIDNMVGETLLGAAFTYARNDVDGSSHFNGQEGKTRSYDLALYGSTPISADKQTYVNYQLGGGIMDTSTRRQFFDLNCCNDVVASGTYDTKFARASINLNHRMDLSKKTSFTPSAGLTYTYMDEDAYTEKGAGDLKLHVKSNQTDQALATLAGRFDFYPTDGVRLYASALAGYDMINEQVDLKANFVNLVDSAFTTKGIDQSPWMGNAKAGISVNVADVELNAGYSYTYRSDFDNHMATLRALYSF